MLKPDGYVQVTTMLEGVNVPVGRIVTVTKMKLKYLNKTQIQTLIKYEH